MGVGFDPANGAPALLALIVAAFVWRRHRVDRRARLFLALAAAEFFFGIPLALMAATMPSGRFGLAAVQALVIAGGLLATILFLHFGLSFPHARPWLRRGRMKILYSLALLVAVAIFVAGLRSGESERFLNATMIGLGGSVLVASLVACVAIYRSFREMTADERTRYRVPVIGVLAGMAGGVFADLFVSILFGLAPTLDARYVVWAINLTSTFSQLLLPLFFFMAAVKYRLLEHHSQDYVAKL